MHSKTILLVEDNPNDREFAQRALQKTGLPNKMVVAEDGQEALDYLFGSDEREKNGGLPALILLDLKLPKVPGLEVLRRIREDKRTRRVPVVILTTSNLSGDIDTAYDYGTNSFVCKPVDFKQFADAIQTLCVYWLTLNQPPPEVGAYCLDVG